MGDVTDLPKSDKEPRLRKRKAKVIILDGLTRLDIPADRVLKGALGRLEKVVVMGWDKDDDFYFAASMADGGDVLWLLELTKSELFQPSSPPPKNPRAG